MRPIQTASPRAKSDSRKTIRIARTIATIQMDLVNTIICALDEKLPVEIDPTIGLGIDFDHPTANPIRIKLLVPRSVKRVGKIHTLAVAADFNHLRSPGKWLVRVLRMGCAIGDTTD